jgi:DNA-binding MarR family transcriptional regulator
MPNTDEYIGVVISDVARLLRTEFDRRVRRLGITRAQWLVLTRLHRRPGASHSELAEMMEVEKATAGRMIDRLVANGWVERRIQSDDRRVKRVYLTREAERVHKRIWRVAEDTVNGALADLSGQEGRQLIDLLQRIKKTLLSEDGADGAHNALSNPARKRASKPTLGATVRHNGRAVPRIAS